MFCLSILRSLRTNNYPFLTLYEKPKPFCLKEKNKVVEGCSFSLCCFDGKFSSFCSLPLLPPSGLGGISDSQESTPTGHRWHRSQTHPPSRPAESIPWKHCIWPGCSLVPSAFLTPAHSRNGCRENWFLIQKPRVAMFPAHIPLFQSWELSWQILWRSAMASNNNMHHQLWWHCQIKTWSWFYPSPQSSLNLNFNLFHLFLSCSLCIFCFLSQNVG